MTPTYRALSRMHNGVGFVGAGVEFDHLGWPAFPEKTVEPANAAAERVIAYYAEKNGQFGFPVSPYNSNFGRIYLPAQLGVLNGARLPALPRVEMRNMPRYQADWGIQFGALMVPEGREFAFTAWPVDGISPANRQAEEVADYFEANRLNPRLPLSPWCEFERAIFLPDLPPAKKISRDVGMGINFERPPLHPELQRGRLLKA